LVNPTDPNDKLNELVPMNPTTKHDFIDEDRDRFNVRVFDKKAWDIGSPIQVTLRTENEAGFEAYNESDDTKISLSKMPQTGDGKYAQPGWFWSDSQMLVSNAADDKLELNDPDLNLRGKANIGPDDQGPNAGVTYTKNGSTFQLSDRTHRIALGGTVRVDYAPGGPAQAVTASTKVAVGRTVTVNLNILTVAGNALITKAEAEALVKGINEQFAQVGVRVVASPTRVPAPANVDLTNGLHLRPDGWNGTTTPEPLSAEERDLVTKPLATRTDTEADIEVYFINHFVNDAGTKLVAPNPRVVHAVSYIAAANPGLPFADSIVYAVGAFKETEVWKRQQILAHEIGHVLRNVADENFGHYTGPASRANLMCVEPSEAPPVDPLGAFGDGVLASKRFTENDQTRIYDENRPQ
jgi:hypothetical protein